jgi:hypothetical protein
MIGWDTANISGYPFSILPELEFYTNLFYQD